MLKNKTEILNFIDQWKDHIPDQELHIQPYDKSLALKGNVNFLHSLAQLQDRQSPGQICQQSAAGHFEPFLVYNQRIGSRQHTRPLRGRGSIYKESVDTVQEPTMSQQSVHACTQNDIFLRSLSYRQSKLYARSSAFRTATYYYVDLFQPAIKRSYQFRLAGNVTNIPMHRTNYFKHRRQERIKLHLESRPCTTEERRQESAKESCKYSKSQMEMDRIYFVGTLK